MPEQRVSSHEILIVDDRPARGMGDLFQGGPVDQVFALTACTSNTIGLPVREPRPADRGFYARTFGGRRR